MLHFRCFQLENSHYVGAFWKYAVELIKPTSNMATYSPRDHSK